MIGLSIALKRLLANSDKKRAAPIPNGAPIERAPPAIRAVPAKRGRTPKLGLRPLGTHLVPVKKSKVLTSEAVKKSIEPSANV